MRKERKCRRALFNHVKLPDCKSCCLDLTTKVRKEMFHRGKASQLNRIWSSYSTGVHLPMIAKPPVATIDTIFFGMCQLLWDLRSPLPCTANLLPRAPGTKRDKLVRFLKLLPQSLWMWPLSTSKSPPFRCPPGLKCVSFQSTLCLHINQTFKSPKLGQ